MPHPSPANPTLLARLVAGARALGVDLSPAQLQQFALYRSELRSWHRRANLTSITDPEEVETRHFVDSLSVVAAPEVRLGPGLRVLEVGSGAGFPGLPLKIAYPEIEVTLLEATGKKADFLRHVADRLALPDVAVITGRAEDAAREPAHREAYSLVLARALAPMAALAELTLPFCQLGGHVVAQKKGDIAGELEAAKTAIEVMGGRCVARHAVSAPGLEDGRCLVVLKKVAHTPEKYPRRPGVPAKRPIARRG